MSNRARRGNLDVQSVEIKFKFSGKVYMLQKERNYHLKAVCLTYGMVISSFSYANLKSASMQC